MPSDLKDLWKKGNVTEWSRLWWTLTSEERDEWASARASDQSKIPERPDVQIQELKKGQRVRTSGGLDVVATRDARPANRDGTTVSVEVEVVDGHPPMIGNTYSTDLPAENEVEEDCHEREDHQPTEDAPLLPAAGTVESSPERDLRGDGVGVPVRPAVGVDNGEDGHATLQGVAEGPAVTTAVHSVLTEGQLDILEDELRNAEVVAFDLETMANEDPSTSGEDWHPTSRITTASFTVKSGHSFVLPLSHPVAEWSHDWRPVAELIFKALVGKKLIAHNGKYDVRWNYSMTGVDLVPYLWWDTMVSAYVLDENEPKDLEYLAKRDLGAEDWKKVKIDSRTTEKYPWEDVAWYAAHDTDYTFQLQAVHRAQLAEEPALARIFRLLMMPVCRSLVRVERNGLLLDQQATTQRLAEAQKRITEIEDYMLETYVSDELRETYCWKHYKKKASKEIRPSWAPTSKFFKAWMEDMGAPVMERTKKTGDPSWSADVMKRLAVMSEDGLGLDYPFIADLLEQRHLVKDTGYLKSWLEKSDGEGRLHPSFKPSHTTTGRLSSENPNAQQVSRHLKTCYIEEDGWWFVQADYAQIELRVAAQIAHEKNMLRAFSEGKDLHRIMGGQIAGKEPHLVTKEERQQAKAVNFGFLYGMGAPKFVDYAFDEYGVIFTKKEAQEVRKLFFKTWPRLSQWHEEQRRTAHTQGYVRSPLGRRRRLPELQSPEAFKRNEAERQAINAPVQSMASDLMLMAINELDARLLDGRLNPEKFRLTGTVHDSVLAGIRKGYGKTAISHMTQAMLYPSTKPSFGARVTVPLEVEFQIGEGWGDEEPRVVVAKSKPSTST